MMSLFGVILLSDCPDGQYALDQTCYKTCPPHFYSYEKTIQVITSPTTNGTSTDHENSASTPPLLNTSLPSSTLSPISTLNTDPSVSISWEINNMFTTYIKRFCLPCFSRVCVVCTGEQWDQCAECVDGYKLSPHGECMVITSSTNTSSVSHTTSHHKSILILTLFILGIVLVVFLVGLGVYFRRYKGYSVAPLNERSSPLLDEWFSGDDFHDDERELPNDEKHSIQINIESRKTRMYTSDI